jgi:hypothetical protein
VKRAVRQAASFIAIASCALGASLARADGEQLMPGGAQSVARGGATVARPSDASTLLQNPAGLSELPGSQALYAFDVTVDRLCVDPYGYYGWGVYLQDGDPGSTARADARRSEFGDPTSAAYGSRRLDRVCNSAPILPLPQLALSLKLDERWTVAFGFLAPVLVGGAQFGGQDGTIDAAGESRPTPTRYALIRQRATFALNPTAGVAYRPLPWLSFGVALQVLMASLDNSFMVTLRAGTSPHDDITAKVHASDYFMPALTVGVRAKASRRLQLAGTFSVSDGFDGSGELTLTTNAYHRNASGSEVVPLQNDPIRLKRVRVSAPWSAVLALRYVQPRTAADDGDPLRSDAWDIELDVAYTANRSLSANSVQFGEDFTLEFRRANAVPQMPLTLDKDDLGQLNVQRNLRDVVVVRLGASVNLVPGRLQLSAGGFFQSRGAEAAYASVANYGFARIGLGLGLLVRLGAIDLLASYAAVLQETLEVVPPAHQARTDASDDPRSGFDQRIYEDGVLSAEPRADARVPQSGDARAALQQPAAFESNTARRRVINAGRYSASFHVLSIGIAHRF